MACQHFLARHAGKLQITRHATVNTGQRFTEVQHALEFVRVAHGAPFRMIAILLAAARIAPGRLQVTLGTPADPDVLVRRRNGEAANAGQHGFVTQARAMFVHVRETAAGTPPVDTRFTVADIPQADLLRCIGDIGGDAHHYDDRRVFTLQMPAKPDGLAQEFRCDRNQASSAHVAIELGSCCCTFRGRSADSRLQPSTRLIEVIAPGRLAE
jgi:hypothetical protein